MQANWQAAVEEQLNEEVRLGVESILAAQGLRKCIDKIRDELNVHTFRDFSDVSAEQIEGSTLFDWQKENMTELCAHCRDAGTYKAWRLRQLKKSPEGMRAFRAKVRARQEGKARARDERRTPTSKEEVAKRQAQFRHLRDLDIYEEVDEGLHALLGQLRSSFSTPTCVDRSSDQQDLLCRLRSVNESTVDPGLGFVFVDYLRGTFDRKWYTDINEHCQTILGCCRDIVFADALARFSVYCKFVAEDKESKDRGFRTFSSVYHVKELWIKVESELRAYETKKTAQVKQYPGSLSIQYVLAEMVKYFKHYQNMDHTYD